MAGETAASFRLGKGSALVTGAGSGIGARLALGLAEAGADVGCVDLNPEGLRETVERIEALGRRALALEADVTDGERIQAAVAETQSELGPLRYAVNCAGIHNVASARTMTREVWQQVIDVNLTGVFLSCQAEGNAMIDNGGGSIVNIGSIAASIAIRGLQQVHYNAAKAGVSQLSASLAVEWVEEGIRVNTVSPGHTRTPIAEHPDVYEMVKAFLRDMPMGRLGDTAEIVGPTVFLLSDASSFCTGLNINVDGGTVIGGHGPVA